MRVSIKKTGAYLLGPTQKGLTCATFVLAVFEASGFKLAHLDTWPIGREGDKKWQESIIKVLKEKKADENHITMAESEIGIARFRPEEVAGASLEPNIPVNFDVAFKRSVEIIEKLEGF